MTGQDTNVNLNYWQELYIVCANVVGIYIYEVEVWIPITIKEFQIIP